MLPGNSPAQLDSKGRYAKVYDALLQRDGVLAQPSYSCVLSLAIAARTCVGAVPPTCDRAATEPSSVSAA